MVHWSDVEAQKLIEARGTQKLLFATAITPSGPIHVGNMREVLTTEAIFRGARDAGAEVELLYIADDYDPLRKVYPFLHKDYQVHVGKPLREIPCPDAEGKPNGCGAHDSYAAHYLEPFLANLAELGIEPTVRSAHAMYHEGRFVEHTLKSLDEADKIRSIIEKVSGRQLSKKWAPVNPQCPTCRRISGVDVLGYVKPVLSCRCAACAEGSDDPDAGVFEVRADEAGIGKLPWRIDWPARWDFLGVSFEAFGKDHGAKGGSWDTGVRIIRDVFEGREPEHVMYEFLNLKGQGAMHSSTGLAVSASDILQMTPPEVLRYLLMKQSPRKHIDFDSGDGVVRLVDEFDRLERIALGAEENPGTFTDVERTYQLSCPRDVPTTLPNKVQYSHLVTVAQMADTVEGVEDILRRTATLTGELDAHSRAELQERVHHVRFWLQRFAPEGARFQVQLEDLPEFDRTAEDKAFYAEAANRFAGLEWTGQNVHDAVYAAREAAGLSAGQAFKAVYRAVLGQDRGPRAGFFLSSLDQNWVIQRFTAAAQ